MSDNEAEALAILREGFKTGGEVERARAAEAALAIDPGCAEAVLALMDAADVCESPLRGVLRIGLSTGALSLAEERYRKRCKTEGIDKAEGYRLFGQSLARARLVMADAHSAGGNLGAAKRQYERVVRAGPFYRKEAVAGLLVVAAGAGDMATIERLADNREQRAHPVTMFVELYAALRGRDGDAARASLEAIVASGWGPIANVLIAEGGLDHLQPGLVREWEFTPLRALWVRSPAVRAWLMEMRGIWDPKGKSTTL